jgi:hypothetical protein
MMKQTLWVLLCGVATQAAVPELEPGVYLRAGGGILSVKPHTAPCAIDWNNDGRKDLLVGQFDSGNIWLFLNQGADADPVLAAGQLLRVGGANLTTSYG